MIIEMTLGNRIKTARERLTPKVTQQEIAGAFGITVQAVSGWERDEAIPDFDKLSKLRRKLKVPLDWLVEGETPPPAENLAFIGRTRIAREAKFKTQKPVYEFLGVGQSHYKHWETQRPLPRRYIPKFCTICEVSMEWLLTGEGKGPEV